MNVKYKLRWFCVKNDYMFWNDYLNETIKKIEKMIQEKDVIYIDFHMHSDYSADGKQSLAQIIDRTKNLGMDIISITDHDSLGVYDEIFEMIKKSECSCPIIIPGVEFTIENSDYGSQFHILQLMINPKEKNILDNVKYNMEASWIRTKKQFKRISENETLQFFFHKYHINCSEEGYRKFLNTCKRPIPEYSTLAEYLMKVLWNKGITTWDILCKLEENNIKDTCLKRRKMKEERYKKLREKYKDNQEAHNSSRFLMSMLAVKGVDDDYFPNVKSSGSLSVNNYNELKLEQLNKNHITFFAHPNENRLDMLERFKKLNSNISGMEYNKQCNYSSASVFYKKANELNMIQIIGSDSHSIDSSWYDDMNFYRADKIQLRDFINKAKEYISENLT